MRLIPICILLLFSALAACTKTVVRHDVASPSASPSAEATGPQDQRVEQELERRLRILCEGAQGAVGVSVVHIQSGKTVS
ncbi:MAG TPA: hypothetical protein VHH35_20605, partial [Pyrinomonadaceae bacterium]|nr:hypothetical protein [Pyrinomonadaceae bacterium]